MKNYLLKVSASAFGPIFLSSSHPTIITTILKEIQRDIPDAEMADVTYGEYERDALSRGLPPNEEKLADAYPISGCKLDGLGKKGDRVYEWILGYLLRNGWEPYGESEDKYTETTAFKKREATGSEEL